MNTQKDHHSIKNELARATDLDNVAKTLGNQPPSVFAKIAPNGEESLANSLTTLLKNIVAYDARAKQWYLWDGQLHKPVEAGESINITAGFALLYLESIIEAFAGTDGAHREALDNGTKVQDLIKTTKDKDAKEKLEADHADEIISGDNVSKALAGPTRMLKALQNNRDQKSLAEMLQRKLPLNTAKRDADDKRFLVFANGVLDMNSIKKAHKDAAGVWQYPEPERLDHNPNRLVWRAIPHNWDPQAKAPSWDELLSCDSFDSNLDAEILEQLLGIGLSGQVYHFPKHFASLYGSTNSGKGLLTETLKRILPDHVMLGDHRIATKTNNLTEQARLRYDMKDSRIVVASECTTDIDGDFLLDYAGNGAFTVRQMNTNPERVLPQGIMILTSNDPVKIDASKPQLRDRLYPVYMPYRRVPETNPAEWARDDVNMGPYTRGEDGQICKPMDSDLPGKLDAEAVGITTRLIRAYQEALIYSSRKIPKSEPMEARLRESAEDSDMFSLYLKDFAEIEHSEDAAIGKCVRVMELHAGYSELCRSNRVPAMTSNVFARKMNGYQLNGNTLETSAARGGSRLVGHITVPA